MLDLHRICWNWKTANTALSERELLATNAPCWWDGDNCFSWRGQRSLQKRRRNWRTVSITLCSGHPMEDARTAGAQPPRNIGQLTSDAWDPYMFSWRKIPANRNLKQQCQKVTARYAVHNFRIETSYNCLQRAIKCWSKAYKEASEFSTFRSFHIQTWYIW